MLGVRRVDAVAGGEVQDARAPHVLEQRRVALEVRAEEDALAQPRLGDLDRVEAAGLQDALHDDRAGEDEVGARVLDALDRPALARRQVGELLDQRVEALALDLEALHAERRHPLLVLHRGGEVAHRAADADEPASRPRQPRRVLRERLLDVRAQRLAGLLRRLVAVGQEVLGHAHRAQRPGVHLAGMPAANLDELQRAATEVEHDAVGERRRVHRGEVAVVRLLRLREHADAQPGLLAHALEELALVGSRRGSRSSRRARRPPPRCRSPCRSARTPRPPRARASSAWSRACRSPRAPRRRARRDRSRRSASTTRRRP